MSGKPAEMTASDLRALAQLVAHREVVVVRHENLLAVLRPSSPSHLPKPASRRGTTRVVPVARVTKT